MHFALSDRPLFRLTLVTGRELGVITITLVVLLFVVFTGRNQFQELLKQSRPDALSVAYMESMLHSEPGNFDLRLQLARAKADYAGYSEIASLLEPVKRYGNAEQHRNALHIQLHALIAAYNNGNRSLPSPDIDVLLYSLARENRSISDQVFIADSALSLERIELARKIYLHIARESPNDYRKLVTPAVIHNLAMDYRAKHNILSERDIDDLFHPFVSGKSTAADLSALSDSALLFGREKLAWELNMRIVTEEPHHYHKWVESSAKRSLGLRHYRLAADLFFLARQGAVRSDARRLFKEGIDALMADSRFNEAMSDADHYLGDLADDGETLRFLILTARAANNNQHAAKYARLLLNASLQKKDLTPTSEVNEP